MSWADLAIRELSEGRNATIKPKGQSMRGKVESGSTVTLSPPDLRNLDVGDVVLVKVRGRVYLHKITAKRHGQFQIGNNKGHINGWVAGSAIYGVATRIEEP